MLGPKTKKCSKFFKKVLIKFFEKIDIFHQSFLEFLFLSSEDNTSFRKEVFGLRSGVRPIIYPPPADASEPTRSILAAIVYRFNGIVWLMEWEI